MSIESSIHQKRERTEGEIFTIRMHLQMAVAQFFLGENSHDQEKMIFWLDEYSKKFAAVFEKKKIEDPTFLDRAVEDSPEFQKTVQEIAVMLRGGE